MNIEQQQSDQNTRDQKRNHKSIRRKPRRPQERVLIFEDILLLLFLHDLSHSLVDYVGVRDYLSLLAHDL